MIISRATTKRLTWLTAAALALMVCQMASTRQAIAEPAPQPPAAQQQPKEPGFFESIGRWFERGFSNFKGSVKDAKSNLDNFGDKAANAGKDIGGKAAEVGKGAADAVRKLPSTRVIEGHERCDVSANGAPDCRAAALLICTGKGFANGSSVDFVSAEKCPAAVWMKQRKAEPGECFIETFVTRAMCQ